MSKFYHLLHLSFKAPYSSLPPLPLPQDNRPAVSQTAMDQNNPRDYDYAQQLRRNQMKNVPTGSMDRIPPPNAVSKLYDYKSKYVLNV